jgi:hypothetical protein
MDVNPVESGQHEPMMFDLAVMKNGAAVRLQILKLTPVAHWIGPDADSPADPWLLSLDGRPQ